MKNLILIWSLLLPYLAFGQATNSDTQYRNDGETLINGSFEQGKKGYTFTVGSGSTVWSAQSTTSLNGRAMQLTLSAQTFSFKSATTQGSKLSGQNGYVEVYLSASASGAEFCPVVDGVSAPTTTPNECQPIIAGVGFKSYGIQKVFGATSLNYEIRGVSNAAYTGTIYADDGSVAKTSKIQSELISYSYYNAGTITIASTGTQPTKGVIVTDRIMASRKGQKLIAEYQYEQSSGGSNGTGDFLFTLPSGLSFDSSVVFFQTGVQYSTPLPKSIVGYGKVADASNPNPGVQLVAYDATRFRAITATNSAANFMSASAYGLSGAIGFGFHLEAPIAGWADSNIKFLNQPSNGWFIDVNIGGGNPVTSGTPSSYAEITDANLDLVINSGSAIAEIPCSATNPSTGLTCSAGSEGVGVVFTPPKTGRYKACAYYTSNYGTGSAATQLVETPNNAQTILQEGKTRLAYTQAAGSGGDYSPHTNCGFFNFTDTAKKTIRLMGEVNSSNITIQADRASSVGQRDIHITVEPVVENIQASLQSYPAIPGSVNPKLFGAKITTTTGVVTNNKGGVVTTCTAANPTTCTFVGLTTTPLCSIGTNNGAGSVAQFPMSSLTSSGVSVESQDSRSAALLANATFDLTCFGE